MTYLRCSVLSRIGCALFSIFAAFGVALFSPVLALPYETQSATSDPVGSGQQLYVEACSTCHGLDGRGEPQSHVGFDLPLPDFTDCSFASREPNLDWIAVAHDGGPARAFSTLMPAFGDALSMAQLERIADYMRSFCGNDAWPRGEFNLPRPLVTEKAFPEDEAVFMSTVATEGPGSFQTKVVYEKRIGARNQVEFILPLRWQREGDWKGGIGDSAVAVKRAFYHNLRKGTILSAAGEVILPTGDSDRGLGKGTTIFEPFVAFGQLLPSDSFIQAQAGLELPADTEKAGREGFWRLTAGRTFTSGIFGRAWSPMMELLAARDLESGAKTNWDVVPQLQVSLSTRQHIMMNVGVRLPVTDSDPRRTELIFYLLWDWFDGGFFEGW